MPINEIFAPFYSIMHYNTSAKPSGHTVRLYLDSLPAYGTGTTVFPAYTDSGHALGYTLRDIWDEVLNRLYTLAPFSALTFGEIEMWESASGVNTFKGLDPDDYASLTAGAGAGAASAYVNVVCKAADRSQFRFTIFEGNDARPQHYNLASPPATDNGTFQWFMLKSAVKFVTNDDLPLVTVSTANLGYNRANARKYGKDVIP